MLYPASMLVIWNALSFNIYMYFEYKNKLVIVFHQIFAIIYSL